MEAISNFMNSLEISLTVFGLGFGEVKLESGTSDKVVNEEFLKRFCELAGGIVIPCSDAIEAIKSIRTKTVRQVNLYKGPFEICDVKINVCCHTRTSKPVSMPLLAKMSTIAHDITDTSKDACKVEISRCYKNRLDVNVDAPEILEEDRVKAYSYGREKIPISRVDADVLKFTADKCLKTIAFIKKGGVPRHYYMAGVNVIVADPDCASSALSMAAFVEACEEKGMEILVR